LPSTLTKVCSCLTAQRIFAYALALAAITNAIGLGLYLHVPSFSETPGADFVAFYSVAKLSRVSPENLYSTDAQTEMQRRFSPRARQGVYWAYLYPPFFTVLLSPLSTLSYVEAYWAWTMLTVALSLLSVVIVIRMDAARRPSLGMGLAVAYAAPVLYWLVATGQTTGLAFFLWSLAFALSKRDRHYGSGLILGFLSYRPQYLTVLLPLLLIRRMWTVILGVATSCSLLFVVGGLMYSFGSYWGFIESIAEQSRRIVTLTQPVSHYITLYGFFRELLPHYGAVGFTIASAIPLIYWTLKIWRNVPSEHSPAFDPKWASLMTSTLLLMHHGFVYDLLILTVPILLIYPYRSLLPAYYKPVLITVYFMPYIFLMFPGKLPINPIQPILYWLCYEIYRLFRRVQPQAAYIK
jgi:Glycosyltransferase family 87